MRKRNWCLSVVLIVALTVVMAAAAGDYQDVPQGAWYQADVAAVTQTGLMNGVRDGEFAPDGTVTQAQAVTLAVRLHAGKTGNALPDTADAHPWFAPYAQYAETHALAGDWLGQTGWDGKNSSRLRFAALLAQALPQAEDTAVNTVADGQIPDLPMETDGAAAVYRLYRCGILTGSDQYGSFMPENSLTRAQAAAILARADDPARRVAFTMQAKPVLPLANRIICVDPGHEVTDLRVQEPYNPYSTATKEAFVGGTSGQNQTEEQLNLKIGLKLQSLLEAQGATVVMTRTTHESDMTSYKRALLANEANAALCIRIHADGVDDSRAHGMSMLVPEGSNLKTQAITADSRRAGALILEETVKTTGAYNRGVVGRNDLTGFNFAEVPTVLIEMGFMTNPAEDAKLDTDAYQNQLAQGMCNGILCYFAA